MPARIWFVTAAIAAIILYGSLYPFHFRVPPHDIGPVAALVRTWNSEAGRADFTANVLLYMPLGFCLTLLLRSRARILTALLTGVLLSVSIELTQYYDAGRITSATDVYANGLGTLLGGIAALVFGGRFLASVGDRITGEPVPLLLIVAWLGYRLYPYVPTIDLHKYWNSLKPLIFAQSVSAYDLFRQFSVWLTLYVLLEAIAGNRRFIRLALLFTIAVFYAKILIIGMFLRPGELGGAGVALVAWIALRPVPLRLRYATAAFVLCAYVVALRLEPFHFQSTARAFGWVPFRSLMGGSIAVDTLQMLEKFFLYGSMLYLISAATGRWLVAALAVTALLFATSLAETHLPGRSAEITDPVLALMIGALFCLLPARRVV